MCIYSDIVCLFVNLFDFGNLGRNLKGEYGNGNGNSRNRNAAVSSSMNASSSKTELKKSRGSEIRYVYPSADSVVC